MSGEHTAVAEAVDGKAIALGHGMANRLNPLDEGLRPSGLDDAQWAAQVTARRRDLLGALSETVLDRRLTALEHTAVDVALAGVVRVADVPVLPMVADRLGSDGVFVGQDPYRLRRAEPLGAGSLDAPRGLKARPRSTPSRPVATAGGPPGLWRVFQRAGRIGPPDQGESWR